MGGRMNIEVGVAEIESANNIEVFGEWVKFTDNDNTTIKITPFVVQKLMTFAKENESAFDEGAWEEE
jgi:hypothetical protein